MKKINIALISLLILFTVSCKNGKSSSSTQACQAYIKSICNLCGTSSSTCKSTATKTFKCRTEGTCNEESCKASQDTINKVKPDVAKKLLCTQK